MPFTVREFKELLNLLPEEVQDYRVAICKDLIDNGGYKCEPVYDSVLQIQIKKNRPFQNSIIIHGDWTCVCDYDDMCIWPIVDDHNRPIKD